MNGRPRCDAEPAGSASPISVAKQAIELSELQFQLLRSDLHRGAQYMRSGVVALVAGAAFLVAALPVLLLALSACFETYLEMPRALSLLAAGAIGAVASIASLALAWRLSRRATSNLQRSADEFRNNLQWVKDAVSSRGASQAPVHPRSNG